MRRAQWEVEFHPECERWVLRLVARDAEALLAAVRILRDEGPNLGRPLVDAVVGSRHNNMKELRPGSTGRSELRVLFAFDRQRKAILLIGGDKSGDWKGWYKKHIPIADERFDKHQAEIKAGTRSVIRVRRQTKRKGKQR